MRLVEFDSSGEVLTQLLTVLNFLRQRAAKNKKPAVISFPALSYMMSNFGGSIDFESFKSLYDNNREVKDLIKNFNADTITIDPYGDTNNVDQSNPDNADLPSVDKVDTMAKRALRKRQ
jgi:hypothetical protein